MTVGSICSREVVVAAPEEPLRTAAELMRTYSVGSVVVCEHAQGRRIPIGIVTDRDIALAVLEHCTDLDRIRVHQAMSADPLVLYEDDDVSEALEHLRARAVRRAPVVDATGALVGIVSTDDLLDVLIGQLNNIVQLVERQTRANSQPPTLD
jgi:CBS domain-containing protein